MDERDIIERAEAWLLPLANGGPHEWGYRDPVDGGFIEDNAPFEAAEIILDFIATLNALRHDLTRARETQGAGFLPIVLCPTDGVWRTVLLLDGQEVVAAFEGNGLGPMARRWRTKTFCLHNPSRPSGDVRGGVEQMTAAYDTFVIEDLPEGIYPTHFRPNDTVFGGAK